MGQILEDGTVIPSMLSASRMQTSPDNNAVFDLFNDLGLRVGVVVASYEPDDEKNTSKKVWQYDVQCAVSDGLEMSIPQIYPRCVVASMFGGVADFERWKPRIETSEANQNSQTEGKVSNNSYVLVACPNGDTRYGYIVGAIPHPNAETDPSGDEIGETYWVREYNGVRFTVNGKGELTIERKGPTKIDGKPEDENDEKKGAKVSLLENGDVTIENGKGDKLRFNFEDRAIEIETDKNINIKSTNGNIVASAQKIQLGGDQEHLILGDTYRSAEDDFFQDVNDFMRTVITGLGTVAGSFTMEAGAGASIGALVAQLAPYLKALPKFKARSTQYLSRDNTTK